MGTMNFDPTNVATSVSLYENDLAKLTSAIAEGKRYARSQGHNFFGATIDVDNDGHIAVHIAGLDTLYL